MIAHPDLPLTLDDEHVVHDEGEIVARPVRPTAPAPADLPEERFIAVQRVPGAVVHIANTDRYGLLAYSADGFDTPAAQAGRAMLHQVLTIPRPGIRIADGWTYTFVVGDTGGLWLCGVRHTVSGDEVIPEQWKIIAANIGCHCVALKFNVVDLDALREQGSSILHFDSGLRFDIAA